VGHKIIKDECPILSFENAVVKGVHIEEEQ
jgi:hypothetical protein